MKAVLAIITYFQMLTLTASELSIQKLDQQLAASYRKQLIELIKTDEYDRFVTPHGVNSEQTFDGLITGGKQSYIATHDHQLLGFITHAYMPEVWDANLGPELATQVKQTIPHEKWDDTINVYTLHHLLIHPEHRGKSIGTQLINQVINDGKIQNISGIIIGVRRHNEVARAFYQKLGSQEMEGIPQSEDMTLNLKLNLRSAD